MLSTYLACTFDSNESLSRTTHGCYWHATQRIVYVKPIPSTHRSDGHNKSCIGGWKLRWNLGWLQSQPIFQYKVCIEMRGCLKRTDILLLFATYGTISPWACVPTLHPRLCGLLHITLLSSLTKRNDMEKREEGTFVSHVYQCWKFLKKNNLKEINIIKNSLY